jgi:hypothetical protein
MKTVSANVISTGGLLKKTASANDIFTGGWQKTANDKGRKTPVQIALGPSL